MDRSTGLIALTLIALLGSIAVASPKRTIEVELLHVGEYSATDVSPTSGEVWFALISDSSSTVLRDCRIRVRSLGEPTSTGGGHSYRRLDIAIDPPVRPKILVRGIPNLREGPLRTDMSGNRWIRPNERAALGKYKGENIYLEASERPFPKGQPHRKGWTQYSLELKGDGTKSPQHVVRLDRWPDSPLPTILWAGDMDGDGAPDLLIDSNIGEAGASDVELFLSSMAKGTERVRRVAKLHTLGC